ncbi:hypothetical protein ACWEPM_02175 [Streptomyces sp. NPDC004244]|uniref:hypothetical protein n=1 Tax=Streptomyces sp. NPDC101206 TaxID=3366128 RepID=UPI00380BD206
MGAPAAVVAASGTKGSYRGGAGSTAPGGEESEQLPLWRLLLVGDREVRGPAQPGCPNRPKIPSR